MAKAAAISFKEFQARYSTEDACREELFHLRFPNGFICPKCGHRECYPIRTRNTYQCCACRHQTSVTAGTVMHRTRLPLTVWFWAIYHCAIDKRGISAVQLSHTLNICYDSAWHLLTRIRTAMGQRDANYQLSGIVEFDDAYIGGNSHNGKRGRGTSKPKIVVALSKTAKDAALFVRMKVVDNLQHATLQQFADEFLTPKTVIQCDGYSSYQQLNGVQVQSKTFEIGDLHWLHKAISNLKAMLLGTYHGRCTKLQMYLDEFCFRFNRRLNADQLFLRLTRAVATSCGRLS